MQRVARALADLGLPDRWGVVGGIREKVAALLLSQARALGPDAFREAATRLIEVILEEVQHGTAGHSAEAR